MKAKEFVNKNIKFGDKVRITLMTGKTVDCFFGGYKTYGNVEPSLDYLLPTFYTIGKNGDMAKRSPFGPTTCPRLPFSSRGYIHYTLFIELIITPPCNL